MFFAIRNAKAYPGKVPVFKFDFGIFESPDIRTLVVTLVGVRHQAGRFLPAQARLRNGSFWDHWRMESITAAKMLHLAQLEPEWAEYQRFVQQVATSSGWSPGT